ncbi:group-specific protein [Niallia circulans]|uniref:Group-specific protein n=2 Tax=Niallia TaxID=2837506 RepID=A0A0J1I3Z7_NIACI|nr:MULTISPECIES: IDEAL domain-containing protein [Bacillaceae]SLL12437.1 IDEAL domain [Mycobacteroides abscessus subsp. abscessus]HEO8421886.1 IDEAL domain-containing protein [Yersinia enterocolitica]KAB7665700.1 IDEAL domain-containing protein [Bacillus sp. B1-b2]KLV20669.1 group-specific protein [Niallia circulans]MCF2650086.1 IDEAL domain-containing protein [Niallia circulans]
MLTNGNSVLKTGDWIKGKSEDGELIIGYIESQSILDGVVKVTVATSDNRETLGKTIPILSKNVRKLPLSKVVNKEEILFLIDLALSTGDEAWFIELSSKLNSINQLVDGVH